MSEKQSLPSLSLSSKTDSPRITEGNKAYCTKHGTAHLDAYFWGGSCPRCDNENKPALAYENIVLVSRKQPRVSSEGSAWDGKHTPFIGEVISVHFVGTVEQIAAEKKRLRALHR